jgi:hypothetical protein
MFAWTRATANWTAFLSSLSLLAIKLIAREQARTDTSCRRYIYTQGLNMASSASLSKMYIKFHHQNGTIKFHHQKWHNRMFLSPIGSSVAEQQIIAVDCLPGFIRSSVN